MHIKIFNTPSDWQTARKQLTPEQTLGFVPTMGNLHQGHASLIERSLKENDKTVVSLFVNPTQFNQPKDFEHYPRTLQNDINYLQSLGVDYCFKPNEKDMYPDDYRFQVCDNHELIEMEAQHRPGHFKGVMTVVLKLLLLTRPDRAYFGEKDYQQFQLIKDMAEAFLLDTAIIPCATIREASGLPFSSRNNRLNQAQRNKADQFAKIFHQNIPLHQIEKKLKEAGLEVQYLQQKSGRKFVAIQIDDVRLIDNVVIT